MSQIKIRSSRPYFNDSDIKNIASDIEKVLKEGRLRNGENLRKFEKEFSNYINIKNAIATDSDCSALELILKYFNIEGKEVIVCTNSFISIPNSVVYSKGKVIFADINENSISLNPDSFKKLITENTHACIITHISGFPNPNLKEIIEICKEKNIILIEDATHAPGASINNKKIGTYGAAAVFAFTPTKVITTGEGGIIVTDDDDLFEYAYRNRYYGAGKGTTEFENLGRHMLLPEISAILGRYQIERIDEYIKHRNVIAKIYDIEITKFNLGNIIDVGVNYKSSYYKYPIILNEGENKNIIVNKLIKEYGIETGTVFYPPCHMQPTYRHIKTHAPIAEKILARTITLPIHLMMNENDAFYVVDCLRKILNEK